MASDITLVISTAEGREEWLDAAVRSAQASAHYGRLLVASSPFYETGALAEALTMVGEDERFLFIGDSMHIMSSAFFDHLPDEGSAWLFGRPTMYAGIYEPRILSALLKQFPPATDKHTAIHRETAFCDPYGTITRAPTIWPEVTDETALYEQDAFGRRNLVLGNEHIVKYKGTWASGVRKPLRADVGGVETT